MATINAGQCCCSIVSNSCYRCSGCDSFRLRFPRFVTVTFADWINSISVNCENCLTLNGAYELDLSAANTQLCPNVFFYECTGPCLVTPCGPSGDIEFSLRFIVSIPGNQARNCAWGFRLEVELRTVGVVPNDLLNAWTGGSGLIIPPPVIPFVPQACDGSWTFDLIAAINALPVQSDLRARNGIRTVCDTDPYHGTYSLSAS